jgi:hypothetical protein
VEERKRKRKRKRERERERERDVVFALSVVGRDLGGNLFIRWPRWSEERSVVR